VLALVSRPDELDHEGALGVLQPGHLISVHRWRRLPPVDSVISTDLPPIVMQQHEVESAEQDAVANLS